MAAALPMRSPRPRSTLTAAERDVKRWKRSFFGVTSCLLVTGFFLVMTWRDTFSARETSTPAATHPLELSAEVPAAQTVSVTLIPRRNILPTYVPKNETVVAVYVVKRKGRPTDTTVTLVVPQRSMSQQQPDNPVEASREMQANRRLQAQYSVDSRPEISPGTVSQIVATISRHLPAALPAPNIDGMDQRFPIAPPSLDVAVTQAPQLPFPSIAMPPADLSTDVQRKPSETASSVPLANKRKEVQLAAYVPPRPIKWTKPEVAGLVLGKRSGTADIKVKVRIDATGHVIAAHALIDGPTHDEKLMDAAAAAVRRWTFEPATARGISVASEDIVVIRIAGNTH